MGPYSVTALDVARARAAMCTVARTEQPDGDHFLYATLERLGYTWTNQMAVSQALVEYKEGKWGERDCKPRLRRGQIKEILDKDGGTPDDD